MLKVPALPLLCLAVALSAAPAPAGAGLLRVPRVYNALITTDERLLPSRAVSVSAPLLPVSAPLIIGPAPVASFAALAAPAPAPAPVRAAPNATREEAQEPAVPAAPPAPAGPAAAGNATAGAPTEKEAVAPLAPTLLPLYSPYYSYYPSLLPYSLAPPPLSSLVLFHPFLPPAPAAAAPAGAAPPTDPSGRALPPGAKDEPEKDAVSVEA
ncbi:hypothetical protein R5R35_001861 [Gryllus longicercus]|uniref:Uncharacterized protein n=1 Tax=Gryllus longicercus TaxID=2509291 RepID=A0AAN9VK55_9ORTH